MKRISQRVLLALLAFTAAAQAAEETQSVPVSVVEAAVRPLVITASAPAELESLADPAIAAEVEGRVLKVLVRAGEAVEAGQLLATLDPEPYAIALASAKANVARVEALISNQLLTVKRLQDLMRQQSSAQSDLDRAKAELAASRAELASAQARVRDADYQLAKAKLKSPLNGVVQERHISAGDYVRKGDPAFRIVATDTLTARLFIPEALAGRIEAGQAVALSAAGEEGVVEATLSRLLPALDPGNRSLGVLVDFDNRHGWRPGMSLTAEITLERREGAVMVPVRSVVRRPAGNVVYRIDRGHAVAQTVETGRRDGDWVEIRSGLSGGATIALDGAGFLSDAAAVEIREP